MLLLHANEVVGADALVEAVWGPKPPEHARATLQVYIANLRKLLGLRSAARPGPLSRRPAGYRLDVAPDELDLEVFRRRAAAGRAARDLDPREAGGFFRSALSLWHGPAFPDLGLGGPAPPELIGLEDERLGVLEDRVESDLDSGLGRELVGELDALVEMFPLLERLLAQRVVALYRAGRQADALQACRSARERLADELGIDPGPDLQKIEQAVLQQDPWLDACVPVPRAGPTLPAPVHPLIGRQHELATIEGLLVDEHVRVVSVVGPGGTGKTRLALETARRLQPRFPAGVFFVPLASVMEARLVLPTIAKTLKVKETAERGLADVVADRLDRQTTLLVLDNFEQVLGAAHTVATLLNATAAVTVLVTTRAPLRISGEDEYHLAPLPLPPLSPPLSLPALLENDAVRLFIQRARAIVADFQVSEGNAEAIAAICHRVDGLPLAVELAAARIRVLAPAELLTRLDARLSLLSGGPADVPTHQQTLRGTIAWSYDLLGPAERSLFANFAVFAGGCSLDAVEAVCGADDIAPDGMIDCLDALVSQSLLTRREAQGEPRFGMLRTIRDYAQELLTEQPGAWSTHARHAAFYSRLAEVAGVDLAGPRQADWLSRLNMEHDNLRAALMWSTGDHGDPTQALQLATSLARYWEMVGALGEGLAWLETALRLGDGQPPELLVPAYSGAGTLAWVQGDHVKAAVLHRHALHLARQTDDRGAECFALNNLGAQALERGDVEQAVALWAQAGDLAISVDDQFHGAMAKHNLAEVGTRQGDFAGAADLYDDALAVFRTVGDPWYIAGALRGRALTALKQGDYARAETAIQESLTIARQLGENHWIAEDLEALAALAEVAQKDDRATTLLSAADSLRRRIGTPAQHLEIRDQCELLEALHARMVDEAFDRAWQRGQLLTTIEAIHLARAPS